MIPFPFAPVTAVVGYFTSKDRQWEHVARKMRGQLGFAALAFMREEVARGAGEYGGNNIGKDIVRYRGGITKPGSWCAALVYTAIKEGAQRIGRDAVPVKRTHGARKLFRRTVAYGRRIKLLDIQEGDLVLFDRGNKQKRSERWKAHIGMVSRVRTGPSGKVTSFHYIAGNEGKYPSFVQEYAMTPRKFKKLIGFARLP